MDGQSRHNRGELLGRVAEVQNGRYCADVVLEKDKLIVCHGYNVRRVPLLVEWRLGIGMVLRVGKLGVRVWRTRVWALGAREGGALEVEVEVVLVNVVDGIFGKQVVVG